MDHHGNGMITTTEEDTPFATRLAVQAMLSGGPESLISQGQNLIVALAANRPQASELSTQSFEERCPACEKEVKYVDPLKAECEVGHVWRKQATYQSKSKR
jgi:hypothetical protein